MARNEISAQVILKSASGKRITNGTALTSDNLADFAPDAQSVRNARRAFKQADFRVGWMVGVSFSITASVPKFAEFFSVRVVTDPHTGIRVKGLDGSLTYEIPLDRLNHPVADLIETATFDAPPDFGPTEFDF